MGGSRSWRGGGKNRRTPNSEYVRAAEHCYLRLVTGHRAQLLPCLNILQLNVFSANVYTEERTID